MPRRQNSGPIVPEHSTLHWHSCTGQLAEEGVPDCTTLSVPLNYADPSGRHIGIALDMIPASAPTSQQQGVMLVNPGGPGADGLPLAAEVAQGLDTNVTRDYDIVGFDPRGVGSSSPALSCDPNFFSGVRPNYIPANSAAEQVLINRAKAYADDCEKKFGWLLPYMSTEDVARDVDSIRLAFGVAKINYYAFSYGTYIGEVYATLFPGSVRRMVLDSVVDPTGVWYNDNISQDYAFQGRMEAFFAWVAKYDSTYNLGTTAAQVQAAWYRARNQLLAHPVDGAIGADEFDDTYLEGGYVEELWPGLAQALSYLNYGPDRRPDQSVRRERPPERERVRRLQRRAVLGRQLAPQLVLLELRHREGIQGRAVPGLGQCLVQRRLRVLAAQGAVPAAADQGPGLPGILMLQGTLDPATPYAGAQDAHKLLPSARMVVVEGGGNHGQSLEQPSNACVQNYLNAYLASGALPTTPGLVNAKCPAVPAPTPET